MAGNILLKGYTAAISTKLSTELNSLADAATTALSAEIDNSSALDTLADFQLDLASVTISSTTALCTIYIVPTVDGTNYPDWGSSTYGNYNAQYAVGTILVKNVSAAAARANLTRVPLPPGKFKVALRNSTGAALASSGNTLGMRTYAASYT